MAIFGWVILTLFTLYITAIAISKLERLLVRTLISQRDTTIQQQSNRNGQVPNNPTRTK